MRKSTWQLAVRALCALALVLSAFAHRPVQIPQSSDVDLAQYVLPDGTIPILCLTGSDGQSSKAGIGGTCEFCRIASSVALPDAPSDFASCAVAVPLIFGLPEGDEYVHQAYYADARPRGPPSSISNS